MIKVALKYGIWFLVILGIEIIIALFVRDQFVRPYGGDVLVVILVYFFMMFWFSVFNSAVKKQCVALGVLIFAYCVEFLQALDIITLLQLQENRLARVVLGTSFGWWDMLAYTVGWGILYYSIKRSEAK